MKKAHKNRISVWLTIITFLFLFQPSLSKIRMNYIVVIFVIAYIIINSRKMKFSIDFSVLTIISPFIIYFVIDMILKIIINGYNPGYISNVNSVVFPILNIIIMTHFFKTIKKKYALSEDMIADIFIRVTLIQFFCVFLAFIYSPVRDFFLQFSIKNGSETIKYVLLNTTNLSKRGYGLAENLFDSFTLVISLLTTITFNKAINNTADGSSMISLKYIVLSFLFIFISIVNARTGILLSFIGISLIVLFQSKATMTLKKIGFALITVLLVIIGVNVVPKFLSSDTRIWIEGGYYEVTSFLFGQDSNGTGIMETLLSCPFPSDILFGAGGESYLFGYSRFDMGYMRCIWKFGLIGTIILYCCMIAAIHLYCKQTNKKWKIVILSNFVILLIYTFKLLPFSNQAAMFLVFGYPALLFDNGSQNTDK